LPYRFILGYIIKIKSISALFAPVAVPGRSEINVSTYIRVTEPKLHLYLKASSSASSSQKFVWHKRMTLIFGRIFEKIPVNKKDTSSKTLDTRLLKYKILVPAILN